MVFFGKVIKANDDDIVRRPTFSLGEMNLASDQYTRVVGRPRNEWTRMLLKELLKMAGTSQKIFELAHNAVRSRAAVHENVRE